MTTLTHVTYHSYLKLEELLSLQEELSSPVQHDELLFIIIHQSHELWFKLVIHELRHLIKHLETDQIYEACKTLNRVVVITKNLIQQIEILHTLTPDEFLGYRHLLAPASGFQSYQYKIIEFLCGIKDASYLDKYAKQPEIYADLKANLELPSIWDTVIHLLHRQNFAIPNEILHRRYDERYHLHPVILEAVKTVYTNRQKYVHLHFLFEILVEFDLSVQIWRFNHLKNAERSIGYKQGTGGSPGIEYLQAAASRKFFPELWEVRSLI